MEKEELFHCLNCGKKISAEHKSSNNFCAECVLGLDFQIADVNHIALDTYLQKILDFFISDVNVAFNKDPAAKSLIEVLTSYPGIKAILLHRIAHFFWKIGMPYIPRYISEIARELTAIEIHPGAEIGSEFFIDHGTGCVIGETTEIGNNVTIFSGVVLGGTNIDPVKRHPTLGDNIVIGTGAKILGPVTIGNNVKIGANSVVVTDVPPNSVVVGVPGKIISREGEKIDKIDLRHGDLPDPLTLTIQIMDKRIKELENRILDPNERQKKKKDIEIYFGEYGDGI
ncbi:MAG: serine O-acetyltransferase [Candidatus Hermodarchaeota archaeon]